MTAFSSGTSSLSSSHGGPAAQLAWRLDRAEQAWQRVHRLRAQHASARSVVLKTREALRWAVFDGEKRRLQRELVGLDQAQASAQKALAIAHDQALALSDQAAHVGWGVRLGRTYRVSGHFDCTRLLVEELRPHSQALPCLQMLLHARTPSGRVLLVLGRDALTFEPADGHNVIDLTARLAARARR